MFMALLRLILGLIFACLVGGAVQVLFALTPSELAVAGPERWQFAAEWTLQTATVIAILAAPIVLLIGLFAEITGVRSFAFFLLAGVFVALVGFAILYSDELPNDPTIANSYAIAAYLTTGFMAGLAYWLVAGRFAGGRRRRVKVDVGEDVEIVEKRTTTTTTRETVSSGGASSPSGRTTTASVPSVRDESKAPPTEGSAAPA